MDAFKWDNRVKFVVRLMYDIDNNGILDESDFESLALKYTIYEKKGKYDGDLHKKNRKVMKDLWTELAAIADLDGDGQVTVEEFLVGVRAVCLGKTYEEFPQSLKHAISCKFQQTDLNGDGIISLEEYRIDCVSRSAFQEVSEIDECYEKMTNEVDKIVGGVSMGRYQDLYAEFIGSPDTDVPGAYLFGPISGV